MIIGGTRYPISAARKIGNLVFTSGQLPIDANGNIVRSDIHSQVRLAIENLRTALNAEGADLRHVVKVTTWLSSAEHAAGYNEVYAAMFDDPYPTRTTIISGLLAPADIEIEAIAAI